MFRRSLTLPNHSFFLFGPRGTGKTTLLRELLPLDKTVVIDLLDYDTEAKLSARPRAFREILEGLDQTVEWVLVDEIQKIPALLNEIHRTIENKAPFKFALTGSSARKLKRGQANLLAGRAFTRFLFPLTMSEIGGVFNLQQALEYGTLPKLWDYVEVADKLDYLRAYAQTYLREEIQAEGVVRNLQGFRQFLTIAARENGQALNWSNLAQDMGIDAKTVKSYFQILEDTLIGEFLPGYHRSVRKRQKTQPKFYFFDVGVRRALANELSIPLHPKTSEYGRVFEHFLITEIVRENLYRQTDYTLSYFATHNMEIDLIIERPGKSELLIEIKSAEKILPMHLKSLKLLLPDFPNAKALCICQETTKRKVDNILICPWQEAISQIFL